ncbi:MAG: hypothetical protein CMI55_03760 [Parcubacteria group bacterium]|jgi:hypothetical protein|nr:hypothetical protein [Parcubacteria group bacterium]|tara:strand:- start:10465 stop:11019 length:555 start_codon:yes stop_codon:yes gene_type:complete
MDLLLADIKKGLIGAYDSLYSYLISIDWPQTISILRILSLIISFFFLISIILLIFKIRKNIQKSLEMIVESVAAPGLPKKVISQQWQSVVARLESEDEAGYKLAVIEADKIFDNLLKKMGYQGEDMGERLKQITPAQIANIDQVWQAHKVRNRLAHEPDFQLKRHEAKRVIEIYQRAFEDLEVI